MKKNIIIASVVVILIITAVFMGRPKNTYCPELNGQTMRVCYNPGNLRNEPNSHSNLIRQCPLGSRVTLTGNVVEYLLYEEFFLWYETTDGGWIVSDALSTETEYQSKFNYWY